jgi:hypothetical protein
LPITSAIREARRAASTLCSVETAFAASSALKLSAAWAPIASDTVPASAAAMAMLRREMLKCLNVITVHSWSLTKGTALSVAPLGRFGLRGGRCCAARLRSICGTATNKPLTAFRGSGNT